MKYSTSILTLIFSVCCFVLNAQISDDYSTMIKVQKNGLYGYLDDEGKEVIPCNYDHLLDFHEGLVAGRKDGYWVYLNSAGEFVIELDKRYTICGDFHDGKAYVTKGEMLLAEYEQGLAYTHSNEIRYINRQGEEIVHLNQSKLNYFAEYPKWVYFSEGLLRLTKSYLPRSARLLHGYVDTTGQWVIPPRFHNQSRFEEHFSEGLAVVGLHPESQMKQEPPNRYGYIDKTGNWVIMPDFHFASSFNNSVADVTVISKRADGSSTWDNFYIDKNGRRIFPDSIQAPSSSGPGINFINTALRVYIEKDKYDYHYALADTLGNVLTPFDMKYLTPGDYWGFKRDSLVGFMNDLGEVVIAPQYQNVKGFKQGLCVVSTIYKDDTYSSGVINMQNEWVIPMQDEYQCEIKNGLIVLSYKISINTHHYFNRKGYEIDLSGYDYKYQDIQWVRRD